MRRPRRISGEPTCPSGRGHRPWRTGQDRGGTGCTAKVRGLQVGAAVAGLVGAGSFGPARIVTQGREGGIQAGLEGERCQGSGLNVLSAD